MKLKRNDDGKFVKLDEADEKTKELSKLFKSEYGLSNRDVSIRTDDNSVNVTLKSKKSLPYYHDIENSSKKFKSIVYDYSGSGEHLSSSQYVFVDIGYKLQKELRPIILKEIEKVGIVDNGTTKLFGIEAIEKHSGKVAPFQTNYYYDSYKAPAFLDIVFGVIMDSKKYKSIVKKYFK